MLKAVKSKPRPRPYCNQKASVNTDNFVAPTTDLQISWLVCEDCSDLVAVRQRDDVGEVDQTSVDEDKVQRALTKIKFRVSCVNIVDWRIHKGTY